MEMHKQEGLLTNAGMESMTSVQASEVDDWANFKDNDIMQQQSAILAEDVIMKKFQEPLSLLAAEYQSRRRRILLEKIEVLREQYASIRRKSGDGNCLGISTMFTYLESLLKSDRADNDCITVHVEECRKELQRLDDAWLYANFQVWENKRYTGW